MRNWRGFIHRGGNVFIIISKGVRGGGGGSFNVNWNLERSFALRLVFVDEKRKRMIILDEKRRLLNLSLRPILVL
jgi:hypothetical protein